MEEQEYIDMEVKESESLASRLDELVKRRREETGSYNIFVQQVIPIGKNRFTIILQTVVSNY